MFCRPYPKSQLDGNDLAGAAGPVWPTKNCAKQKLFWPWSIDFVDALQKIQEIGGYGGRQVRQIVDIYSVYPSCWALGELCQSKVPVVQSQLRLWKLVARHVGLMKPMILVHWSVPTKLACCQRGCHRSRRAWCTCSTLAKCWWHCRRSPGSRSSGKVRRQRRSPSMDSTST